METSGKDSAIGAFLA